MSSALASGVRINGSTYEPLFWLSGLQVPGCLSCSRNTSNMSEWADSTSLSFHDRDRVEASSILQRCCRRKDPATSLGIWRTISASTQVSFKNATSCTSWCSRQPTPAAAATNQLRYPDSSQLVRREDSSSMKSGPLPSCRDNGGGCARDLMRLVARFCSSEPFVSRQQVVLVLELICE